jgi:tRNA threonylcarbamoyl adenosine modification protein YeaZ
MKILILETSSEKGVLVLSEKETVLAVRPLGGGPELSKKLGEEVDALLKAHSFSPDLIAVGTGPGSYTGIRVGAALAKGLSYGWEIPLIGICSLKGFAPFEEGPFAVLIDARMGGFYTLFGERSGEEIQFQKPEILSPSDPKLQTLSRIASPHPEAIRKKIPLAPFVKVHETFPDPESLARIAYRQFHSDGAAPLHLSYLSSP